MVGVVGSSPPQVSHRATASFGDDTRRVGGQETGNLSVEIEASIDCDANEARIETAQNQEYRVFVVVSNRTTNESRSNSTNVTGPTDGTTVIPFRGEGLVNVAAVNTSVNASVEDPTVLLASRVCGAATTPEVPEVDCDASEVRVTAPDTFRYGVGVLVFEGERPVNTTRTNFTTGNTTVSFADLPEEGTRLSVSVFSNATEIPVTPANARDDAENLTVVSFARVNCLPTKTSETEAISVSSHHQIPVGSVLASQLSWTPSRDDTDKINTPPFER